jgi:hypothetical protein
LDDGDDVLGIGSTHYKIDDVESNATGLENVDSTGGSSSYVILDESRISPNVSVKVPQTNNPDRSNIETIDVTMKVDSIESIEDGRNIYYASPEFGKGSIGQYEIANGVLEQTSNDKAIMTFILEK